MIVTSHPVSLVLPVSLGRSEGIHQSALIRNIALETGILKPEWDEDYSLSDARAITNPDAIIKICMGLAWDEWYIRNQIPGAIEKPGEMCIAGIYMTPDGEELTILIIENRPQWGIKLIEVKLTYKSIKTVAGEDWKRWEGERYDSAIYPIGPLSSQWMWIAQTKGYCRGAGTRFVDLHVLFVLGDYSWPQRPMAYKFCIEYTQQEIDTNWDMMIEYRDDVIRQLGKQENY